MWFLILQIFFFMCIAAALGAALAWWWLRRRFVDVTETHAELTRQVETAIAEGRALKAADVDASLATALAAYRPPQPDFQPLQDRLERLEAHVTAPDPDAALLKERIGAIEQTVSTISASIASLRSIHMEHISQSLKDVAERVDGIQMPDVESVHARVASLAETVSASRPDLAPLQDRIGALEHAITNFKVPEVDLGPVHSGLARLDLTLSELQPPEVDLRPIETRLSKLEELLETQDQKDAFAALATDVSLINAELETLSGGVATVSSEINRVSGDVAAVGETLARFVIPEVPDLDPIHNRLAGIDASLTDRFALVQESISAATPLNDALIATLAAIESDLDVVASRRGPDLEPMFAQLASLDTSVSTIRNELRGQTRLETIERRLLSIQDAVQNPPSTEVTREDLTALEDRLTSIEYGITALHHMLRGRGDVPKGMADHDGPRTRAEAASYEARTSARTTRSLPVSETPAQIARKAEAIAKARRPDDQANLLTHAAFGEGDDLAQIVGVGPILTELLHDVGVFYFWQIAEWSDEDIDYVDEKLLHFKGRIQRDDWVGQARALSEMPGAALRPESD
jgi:predicted flap endonuclease-1-like 5' DNA nuclease/phage shock protein A